MSRITLKALVCKQNNKSFYVAVMNSDDLKTMCFVSRKKEDPLKGFQRLLNEKRAKTIATYLDCGEGVVPPALILSAQTAAQIQYDKKTLELSMELRKETLLVLDGQHRLYGLIQASKTYQIPVVIFCNLTTQEEIRQFIDINTTQKGVPSALLLDIKSQAGTETKIEERQRVLFDRLNSESIMAGMFSPNESKAGKISRTTFNQGTKGIFENGPLSQQTDDIIYGAVNNYIEALDLIFKESGSNDARLTKNVMFKAMMFLFNEICEKCLAIYQNFKIESVLKYLNPLKDLDYSNYSGTNKATESKIMLDVRSALREEISFNGDML